MKRIHTTAQDEADEHSQNQYSAEMQFFRTCLLFEPINILRISNRKIKN
jgi:hypothetical protein